MLSAFGPILAAALESRGMAQREFARVVGIQQGSLQHILKGRRKPPLKAIPKWADALRLKGTDREEFLEAAYLRHAPPYVQDLVSRLRRQVLHH